MDLLALGRKYALHIAGILVLLILASVVYERFFSDQAEFIAYLKSQIEDKDRKIADLEDDYERLSEEERKRLLEIDALKGLVAGLKGQIAAGEVNIDAIQNEVIEIDEAIAIIEASTRGALARSRGMVDSRGERPN